MQTRQHFIQTILQTTTHCFRTVADPLGQHGLQVFHLRTAVQTNHVHVYAVVAFEIGGGKQVSHHCIGIHAVGLRHNHQTCRIFVIGFITQIRYQRQLLSLHLSRDLLQNLSAGNLMWQRGNDDIAVFHSIHGAHFHRATTRAIHFQHFITRSDDFSFGREIRRNDVLAQIVQRRRWLVQQTNHSTGHFADIVRRDIGRHAHSNTRSTVEQHIGQARRQSNRLVHCTVEVRLPLHRALTQLTEQHFGIRGQTRFGITHRGEGLRIVRRTPVTLTVHQRITVREWLRHQYHGLITGAVTMRVILTQHVTHGTGRLFVLGRVFQAEFAHGVHDTSLNRLQAVTDVRQGTIENDVHGVIQVGIFGVLL